MGSVSLPVTSRGRPRRTGPQLAERVAVELRTTLASAGALGEVAAPMVLSPNAKRARARVVELVGRSAEARVSDVVDIAVAVELIHAASLLHDDVIDEASERRGLPTANAVWGPKLAILAGDLLLALALARLRPLGPSAVDRATDVVAEMARGVAQEFMARGRLELGLGAWREMAEAKTGALFGLGARLVVEKTRFASDARAFDAALRRLGVAFQIADDAADYVRNDLETPFQDLRDGVPNFVALVAVEREPGLRTEMARLVEAAKPAKTDNGELEALGSKVLATGAVDVAIAEVWRELEAARFELAQLAWLDENASGVGQVFDWATTLVAALEARRAPGGVGGR
jgi:heptaprenyl diphosphate synthase